MRRIPPVGKLCVSFRAASLLKIPANIQLKSFVSAVLTTVGKHTVVPRRSDFFSHRPGILKKQFGPIRSKKRIAMKKTAFTIGFLFCAVTLLVLTFPLERTRAQKDRRIHVTPGTPADEPFVPGRVLVKFRSNVGLDHARQIVAALGAREDGELPR